MLHDPLFTKITEGLASLEDGNEFERCVSSLLREVHPSIVSVSGGSDSGFDGQGFEDGQIIQLVCTIREDVIGNVTANLTKSFEDGKEAQAVIVATSQALTPLRKRNVEKRVSELGKRLVNIYDRVPIAELLFRNPNWRNELLRISGAPPPLSAFPTNHRPSPPIDLVGRDAEVADLAKLETDAILVGQPGSGKSCILRELVKQGSALFVVSEDIELIADAFREIEPKVLILDDAGNSEALLRQLIQFRQDAGAQFRLITSCWPSEESNIGNVLGGSGIPVLELEGLPQSEILQIIHSMRIRGPEGLLHELLHQSFGKPGLAVTLCELCWNNSIGEVIDGSALTKDTRNAIGHLYGRDVFGLLSFISLGGDSGLSLQSISELVGRSPLDVKTQATNLGSAGVLEISRNGQLSVQPSRLRQALVRDLFLKEPRLDWHPFIEKSVDPCEVVVTLIGGLLLGGTIEERELQECISELSARGIKLKNVLQAYAHRGHTYAHWVLDRFPDHLLDCSKELLAHCPDAALPHFLRYYDTVVANLINEQDALKHLKSWVDSQGSAQEVIRKRVQLLTALASTEGLKSPQLPRFVAELAIRLEIFRTSSPPGQRQTVTFHFGAWPCEEMRAIQSVWPTLLPVVRSLNPSELGKFAFAFHQWVHPGSIARGKISTEYETETREFARRAVSDLSDLISSNWALHRNYARLCENLGLRIKASNNPESEILYPDREPGDKSFNEKALAETARELGQKWAATGPVEQVVSAWTSIEFDALNHQISYPSFGYVVAHTICERLSVLDAKKWFDELQKAGLPTNLLAPFALRICELDNSFAEEFIGNEASYPKLEFCKIEALLKYVSPDSAVWDSAASLIANGKQTVEVLILRNQVPEHSIHNLLRHPDRDVRREVVGAVWSSDPVGVIPPDLFEEWKSNVFCLSGEDYQLQEFFEKLPEAATIWLQSRISTATDDPDWVKILGERDKLHPYISRMPKEERAKLVNEFQSQSGEAEILKSLIGQDADLFQFAINNQETASTAAICLELKSPPTDHWFSFAEHFVNSGESSDDLYHATCPTMFEWESPRSKHEENQRQKYLPLLESKTPVIVGAGKMGEEHYRGLRDDALVHEKRAAIRGELA